MLSEMLSIGCVVCCLNVVSLKEDCYAGRGRRGGGGVNQGACSSGKNDIFKASEEHFPWGGFFEANLDQCCR